MNLDLSEIIKGDPEKPRRVYLRDEVTVDSVFPVIESIFTMADEGPEDITLFINSHGGEVFSAFELIDCIRTVKCKVNTVCSGVAYSCASLILSAGTGLRFASKNSRIMVHQCSLSVQDFKNIEEMKTLNSELKFSNNKVFSLLEEYSKGKISLKNKNYFNKDRFLNAEEAKELGIVDLVY